MNLQSFDKNVEYFHMANEFTRFHIVFTTSTNTTAIIKNFLQNYIIIFGSPSKIVKKFLTGAEFVSAELTNFC